MNGYNEGYYNIIVTQFELDDLTSYLENNEVVYDKNKMNGRYQVGSGRIVTFTHDTPFIEDIVSHPEKNVKYSDRETTTVYDRMGEMERLSDRDYSYDSFIAKPDMQLIVLDSNVPDNRADIISEAKKNASKVGMLNTDDETVSVFVDDIGRNIVIGSDGLRHGMARGKNIIGIVTVKAGEIIKNSIRINELTPSKESATGSYVLIGAAIDKNNNLYIVRSVVNEYDNKLTSMDVLYAINTKKEPAMLNASRYTKNSLSVTDSTISIADLLDYVNKYFPDILPEISVIPNLKESAMRLEKAYSVILKEQSGEDTGGLDGYNMLYELADNCTKKGVSEQSPELIQEGRNDKREI